MLRPILTAPAAAAVLLLTFCLIAAAQEQDRQARFRERVRLVEVTVLATGADGLHATDLARGEFTIEACGKAREIRVFQPVSVGLERFAAVAPLEVTYASDPGGVGTSVYEPRYYVLFFHQVQCHVGAFQRAKQAAIDFVGKRMLPGDRVAVACFDKRIDSELDFTGDRVKVLSHLEGMHLKHRNVEMRDDFFVYLERLAERASSIPHKVTLILIADGMKGIGGAADFDVWDRAVGALQAADVRVFGVDAGGLNMSDPGAAIARLHPRVGALVRQSFNLGLYSQPTGGRLYRYHNNIVDLLERVDYEMSAYYVLGFYLDDDEDPERPVSITIKCSRPGVKLRYKNRFQPLRGLEARGEENGKVSVGAGPRAIESYPKIITSSRGAPVCAHLRVRSC